jgi:hypothetical protein
MKTFTLIFRMDITTESNQPSPEQMQLYMQQWMSWIDWISSQGKMTAGGHHLARTGRVLHSKNKKINKPYTSDQVSIAGYIEVLADDLDDATSLAACCPILQGENTSVEVREVEEMA